MHIISEALKQARSGEGVEMVNQARGIGRRLDEGAHLDVAWG